MSTSTNPYLDPVAQRELDERHLRYLVIANYVYAAFQAIGLLVMVVILMLFTGAAAFGGFPQGDPDAQVAGVAITVIGGLVLVILLISTALQFLLARFLDQRRGHTFCFVLSILNALNVPIGTVLGVLTLIVLMRPTVQHTFELEKRRRDANEVAAAHAASQGGT